MRYLKVYKPYEHIFSMGYFKKDYEERALINSSGLIKVSTKWQEIEEDDLFYFGSEYNND